MRLSLGCGLLLLTSCGTVTRAPSLQSETARAWLAETQGEVVSIVPPEGVKSEGRLAGASTESVYLGVRTGGTIEIPVGNGTSLSQPRRGRGALLGLLAGAAAGLLAGFVASDVLKSPNSDSAGGYEHAPVLVTVPVGMLVGVIVGAMAGAAVGAERRLDVGTAPAP